MVNITDTISVPFTDDQVHWLNVFQHGGYFHPFTCRRRDEHYALNEGILIATGNGWYCPYPKCSYTQNWAWAYMANETFNRESQRNQEEIRAIADADPERPDEAT